MGKRINLAIEEKVWLVEEYIAGRITGREAARRAGVGKSTMQSWISRYRTEGIVALQQDGNQDKRRYDKETRRKVVEEYLFHVYCRKVQNPIRKSGFRLG